ADDAQLMIAANRLQTTLAAPVASSDTTLKLADASQVVANMLLSLDKDGEIVRVVSVLGSNQITVERGFDGTTAALHLGGATVQGLIDAWHHNALASELKAIETALGPNLANVSAASQVVIVSTDYKFGPIVSGA